MRRTPLSPRSPTLVRRYSVIPVVRLGLATLLAASSLTACSSKERAPDTARADSTGAGATPPAPANSVATTTPNTAALPGALTKPIEQYTGDEFYNFVQNLRWGGGVEEKRKCKGNAGCEGTNPSRQTSVRVDAVDGQDSITATNVPANGVVSVRASNRGSLVEDRYGFKPERNLEYYMIVLPGTGGNGRWQFEEVDTTPGARRHISVGTGTFKPCNHPFRRGRANRANFYTCADSPAGDSVQRSNLMMFARFHDPIWIDCAAGCCIAD
jgi:hypothetical protein